MSYTIFSPPAIIKGPPGNTKKRAPASTGERDAPNSIKALRQGENSEAAAHEHTAYIPFITDVAWTEYELFSPLLS